MELTVAQLNLLIERIADRVSKREANQAIVMRLAIAAALTKEGGEVFQEYIDGIFDTPENTLILKPENLSKFGLEYKKEGG